MGCDIHLTVEKRAGKNKYGEEVWEKVDGPKGDPEAKDWDEKYGGWYEGRNYDLFAMLANVRNGKGFAGVETGKGFSPILPEAAGEEDTIFDVPKTHHCRGVPQNASDYYKARVLDYGSDGHSHSWLTLAELKAYDWAQVATCYGTVSAPEYVAWREAGGKSAPKHYCGGTWGGSVRNVDNMTINTLITAGTIDLSKTQTGDMGSVCKANDGFDYYTRVEWQQTYAECAEAFYTRTMPLLEALAKDNSLQPEDVRIVFYFDN